MAVSGTAGDLRYWAEARPIAGERVSGDQFVVAPFDGGTLVAVIDGLGHGEQASAVAQLAARVLAAHAHEPVVPLMQRCHAALRRTRGVVASMASFHAASATMRWIGIGNVESILLGTDEEDSPRRASLITRGGILGDCMPRLAATTVPLRPGDLLLMATDGISKRFLNGLGPTGHPGRLVRQLFERHAKTTDDALILGAQWMNAGQAQASRGPASPGPRPGKNS